ncbi:MAG: glycoside hydrolase family 9 protein [Deltaproteobacteria bacterium]|nr:glycoside hydrolase family 9 protein [Deltaproteobacteria bacterium]
MGPIAAFMLIGCTCSPTSRRPDLSAEEKINIEKPVQLDTEPEHWPAQARDHSNAPLPQQKFRGIHVVDREYLMAHFVDGEVVFTERPNGKCAYDNCNDPSSNKLNRFGKPLHLPAVMSPAKWRIISKDDPAYGESGKPPNAVYRKSKLDGMAQFEWRGNDFEYETTTAHWVYLQMPTPLVQGKQYTVQIAKSTNSDVLQQTFTFDNFQNRSEAIHLNLVGYHPSSTIHDGDVSIWMGDGGARDYTPFEGNRVYLHNVKTGTSVVVGKVHFWKKNRAEAEAYNFFQSPVWTIDFTGHHPPGTYRIVVEGVGASADFDITQTPFLEPFRTVLRGYFYMRIGQDNLDMKPTPRRPLWIPGVDPQDCKIVVTDMHPWHPDWPGSGDRWDQPEFFSRYVKPGAPENPAAVGGHSDAGDWDRHLGHVVNIYDMLLPYLLTRSTGPLASDQHGIDESGNGIPDIIDEAKNEVDFWLSLRFNGGYSPGLTNPDKDTHIMYQAKNTSIAAWANSVNAAMLAAAFRIAHLSKQEEKYLAAAVEAWRYAAAQSVSMLDNTLDIGCGRISGRDLRMTAAAWLYYLTGDSAYERVVFKDNMVHSDTSEFFTENRNQLYAIAAYLTANQKIHFPDMRQTMANAVQYQAFRKEVAYNKQRPSRRSTDNKLGYFHTAQFVLRTILAHAVTDSTEKQQQLEQALLLEAGWSLGRNPANIIQMTTASTPLSAKRSVEQCYTSGANDGAPGLHPGHTPYWNMDDWAPNMIMGRPSWLAERVYPLSTLWPRSELFFNTRYVWAHAEFTPRQTMAGKIALYGYLLGIQSEQMDASND